LQVTLSNDRAGSTRVAWSPGRRRWAAWTVIGFFALLTLFLGSCPDGAMAGSAAAPASGENWLYQCPIVRVFVPAE
jgi:hypothetical protein